MMTSNRRMQFTKHFAIFDISKSVDHEQTKVVTTPFLQIGIEYNNTSELKLVICQKLN